MAHEIQVNGRSFCAVVFAFHYAYESELRWD